MEMETFLILLTKPKYALQKINAGSFLDKFLLQ